VVDFFDDIVNLPVASFKNLEAGIVMNDIVEEGSITLSFPDTKRVCFYVERSKYVKIANRQQLP